MDRASWEQKLGPEVVAQMFKEARRHARAPLKKTPEEVEKLIRCARADLKRLGVDDSQPEDELLLGPNLHPQMQLKILICRVVIRRALIATERLKDDNSDQAKKRIGMLEVLVYKAFASASCILLDLVERQREIVERHDGNQQRRPAKRRAPLRDRLKDTTGQDRRVTHLRALEALCEQYRDQLARWERFILTPESPPSSFALPDSSSIVE